MWYSTVVEVRISRISECVPTRRRTTTTFKLIDRDARGENGLILSQTTKTLFSNVIKP